MCQKDAHAPLTERLLIERFEYEGFHGYPSACTLELIPLDDGRTFVIATETEENHGTSVTNIAEHLATFVCRTFGIEPEKLVWVEHYGYASTAFPERTFDIVTFRPLPMSNSALFFAEPHWRVMTDADWHQLGQAPRPPVRYPLQRY
jgi:hypothetical protein